MLRAFAFSFASLAVILATACNRAATPAGSPTVVETAALLFTVTAHPYPIATSASAIGTPYPGAISTVQPAPTSPPLPTLTPLPPPSPIPPNIISRVKLNCTPQATFAKCSDDTLKTVFEYPAVWGEIEAILRTGGDTGYAYSYAFSALSSEQASLIQAGGRSKDFAEGRGGMVTDFLGYGDSSSQSRCASMKDFIPICEEIKSNVVLFMDFPEAKHICDPSPGVLYSPIAIIEINLPDNPTINGFRFVSPFLSESMAEELNAGVRDILGYAPDTGPTKCGSSSQTEFDGRVKELVEGIRANSVDSDTSENINTFKHIAESVMFQ